MYIPLDNNPPGGGSVPLESPAPATIVVDIGAALAALQASPELADMMNDVLGVPRWREIDGNAKTGDVMFLARWNDCAWEYAAAWWTEDGPYPWRGDCGVAIADDRFQYYMPATPPNMDHS